MPVENIPPSPGESWRFWNYEWSLPRTGRFTICLRLNAANLNARRLNSGDDDRLVDMAEIGSNSCALAQAGDDLRSGEPIVNRRPPRP